MSAQLLVIGYIVPDAGFDPEGAKRALASLPNDRLYEALEQLDPELADQLPENAGDDLAIRSTVDRRLAECIETFADADRDDSDVLTFEVDAGRQLRIWVTGGLSYGDDPTEVYAAARVVGHLPDEVLDQLLRRTRTPR